MRLLLGAVTTLFGIEIPSDSPTFLTIVAVQVLAALFCACVGPMAMLSRKGPGRHPLFGTAYYCGLFVVFLSATTLSLMRWAEDYHLFLLGAISFGAASLGRAARRRRWRGWVRTHIGGMGLSYVVMLTAFYVDNGKSLPVWRDLLPIAYWLMPSIVGIPLIARAMARYGPVFLP